MISRFHSSLYYIVQKNNIPHDDDYAANFVLTLQEKLQLVLKEALSPDDY